MVHTFIRLQTTAVRIVLLVVLALLGGSASAQMDQGTVLGTVQDRTGAAIPGATVVLESADAGLTLRTTTTGEGDYVFPPVKVGTYKVTASSPGFQSTTQSGVIVDVQSRVRVPLKLQVGSEDQVVTVSTAAPILQTDDPSVGQVMDTQQINNTPLNSRNWVYLAQLSPGVAPANGSRGAGKGDFNANGQRAEQNNFVLNGIDNNSGAPDFLNGSSYVVQPPPDALSEFRIQTANFSAEFGHSAGAVINASIKSGTNSIHGSLWEYFRNDVLNARDFNAVTVPKYRQNQFGATLGLPIIRNRLFFFGYAEPNRVVFGNTSTTSVPSARMRDGDFSELLNGNLNSSGAPVTLYRPGSAGTVPQTCNGKQNVICPAEINPIAQNLLKMFPLPNANGGRLYNNYVTNPNTNDNTWQWGSRIDWTVSTKDQAFVFFGYANEVAYYGTPFGPILDGGAYGKADNFHNSAENAAFSESHQFSSKLFNEFRFGYNRGKFAGIQSLSDQDVSANVGLGGIPFDAVSLGGLPTFSVTGMSGFGPPAFYQNLKDQDIWSLTNNLTWVHGGHSIKFGAYYQNLRIPILVGSNARGVYTYNGFFTSKPGMANTGSGVADLLLDQMTTAVLGSDQKFHLVRNNASGYVEDVWRANRALTLNLGIRYDYFQPMHEASRQQGNLALTGTIAPGGGSGILNYAPDVASLGLSPKFLSILDSNHISVAQGSDPFLVSTEFTDFAPRVGFALSLSPKTVLRAGFGIFFGGLQNPSLTQVYPFQFNSTFQRGSTCLAGNCATNGITLANGFSSQIAAGLKNAVSSPAIYSLSQSNRTQYSENFNLTLERQLSGNMAATLGYVGSTGRHLAIQYNLNGPAALIDPSLSSVQAQPFTGLGSISYTDFAGSSSYNSLQGSLKRRFSAGLDFLASYTYSHSLDNAPAVLGSTGDSGYRGVNLIGISQENSNSPWDTRHRVTFNGLYELPFGKGRRFANQSTALDLIVGGWSTDLQFTAQTGFPFTVTTNLGTAGPNGGTAYAIPVRDPFKPGGSPNPSNPGITCAQSTRNRTHWYNPCAFANPPLAFPTKDTSKRITGFAALPYLGGRRLSVEGPGYERINMSLFKAFRLYRKPALTFRVDAFNVLNTPAYGIPSVANNGTNGGQITSARTFQNLTPDARFFQLSAKYSF